MKRKGVVTRAALVLLFGLVMGSPITISRAQTLPWPTFQQNPQRTGLSPYNGSPGSDLRWDYTTAGGVWSSPVISEDGTVYFGSGHWLWALNQDGSLKWNCDIGLIWSSSPAISGDGTIYIGCEDGLYAIEDSITYGRLKWTYPTGYDINAPILVGNDGTIYAAAGQLHAIDAAGSLKWTYHIGIASSSGGPAPSLDGSTVYIQHATAFDYYLAAIDTNGTVKWECHIGSAPFNFSESTPAVGSDSTIYFPLFDGGDLVAINPNGTIKWVCPDIDAVRYSSPAVGPGDTIYVGSMNGDLCAVNPDGTLKWSYATGAAVYSSPAVDASGTIYVGSNDSLLHAINPDGSPKWTYNTGGRVFSSPAIDTTGAVYVGSWENSKLHAIGEPLGVEEATSYKSQVTGHKLLQNYPNPFSRSTTMRLQVKSEKSNVSLRVYDLSGRLVKTLVNGGQSVTRYELPVAVRWDATDDRGREVAAGVYFARLKVGRHSDTKRMVLVK